MATVVSNSMPGRERAQATSQPRASMGSFVEIDPPWECNCWQREGAHQMWVCSWDAATELGEGTPYPLNGYLVQAEAAPTNSSAAQVASVEVGVSKDWEEAAGDSWKEARTTC